MAARNVCDNCGAETSDDLTEMVISLPPDAETFDVCPMCSARMRQELERLREAKRARERGAAVTADRTVDAPPSMSHESSGATLQDHGVALLDVPGVRTVARAAAYAALFVVVFLVVLALLTTLR
jgi:hypothetical protein